MKKLILTTILVAGLHATNTRLITMGGFGDYLVDDANMEVYPTQAYFFPNAVIGELGTGDFQKSSLRINLQVGDEGRFGSFYLCANKTPTDPLSHRLSPDYPVNPGIDAGYFLNRGQLLMGAHVGYMGSYDDTPDSLIRSDIAYARVGLGWLMEGQPSEFSVAYYSISGRNEPRSRNMEGASALELRARSLFPISDQTALVVAAQYHDDNLSDNLVSENTYQEYTARLGFNTTPVKGYTLIMGLNYWAYKESDTLSLDFKGISSTTGLEATITDFLRFRVGASKYFWGVLDDGTQQQRISSFYYNFGLGLVFEQLEIDGHLSQDLLFSGPSFIGGGEPGVFSQVSIKYHFRTF